MSKSNGATRNLALAAASVAAFIGFAGAASAQDIQPVSAEAPQVRFDIPAQPLAQALMEYSRQAHVAVAAPSEVVAGRRSTAVTGEMSPSEALDQLLRGSGLRSQRNAAGGLTLVQADTSSPTQLGAAIDAAPSDEIIVTAQKRDESIRDVPIPMSVQRAEELTEAGLLRVQDYYSRIPGLSLSLGGNGSAPIVTLRGVTTGGETNPTVGVIVDDVPYGASVATGTTPYIPDIDPSDLEQVEVLRGPQGALYGASSIGGLVKFVTLDPTTTEFSGRVQLGTSIVEHGDEYGHSLRGSINLPLTSTFAVRASAFASDEPGYIDNVETGEADVNARESRGHRVTALWRPIDTFSLRLSAAGQNSERLGPDDSDTSLGDFEQGFLHGSGGYERDSQTYAAAATIQLGSAELVSTTGYTVDSLSDSVDTTTYLGGLFAGLATTYFGVDRSVTLIDSELEKLSQELRLSFPVGDRIDLMVGAFYTLEETSRDNDTQAADGSGSSFGSLINTSYDGREYEERALFANAAVRFTDAFDVQLGGRYSEDEQVFPTVLSGAFVADALGSSPFVSPTLLSEGDAFTYLITPRYKISDEVMVYARIASGYRPGGANFCGVAPDVPCSYEADTTQNFDLGVRGGTADGRLTYDAAVYHIIWDDIQIQGILSSNGLTSYTGNASQARSQGVEASVSYRVTEGLTLSGWAAYNDAELTEPFPAGQLAGEEGDRLPYSARVSGNFNIDYEFPVGAADGSVGLTFAYIGDRVGKFQPTPTRTYYPDYTQIDLRAGLAFEHWRLTAFVNNVTDEQGLLRAGLDAEFQPTYAVYTRPMSAGVSIAANF